MTYIVKDECIKCKLMDCVEVCPATPTPARLKIMINIVTVNLVPVVLGGRSVIHKKITPKAMTAILCRIHNGQGSKPKTY